MSMSDYSDMEQEIREAPEPTILQAGTEIKARIITVNSGISDKNDGTGNKFSWEHSESGGWGSVTYLMDEDDYVLLDNPVAFDQITATSNAGVEKKLVLRFDGWMMGLPDMYMDLEKNNWEMTVKLIDKIIKKYL